MARCGPGGCDCEDTVAGRGGNGFGWFKGRFLVGNGEMEARMDMFIYKYTKRATGIPSGVWWLELQICSSSAAP